MSKKNAVETARIETDEFIIEFNPRALEDHETKRVIESVVRGLSEPE